MANHGGPVARCSIVPPYLLHRLAGLTDPALAAVATAARNSLERDRPFRSIRMGEPAPPPTLEHPGLEHPGLLSRTLRDPDRTIFDAHNTETLPGDPVLREGAAASDDPAVREAYEGLGHTHELYRYGFGRASVDDDNLPLAASVHYGTDYDNAFWDGQRMVFGDGDGVIFGRMTASLSVIGHELTHGVTQYAANLVYFGQSGAIAESISDVFGALVEQRALGQTVETASWLIGAGLFTDQVQGRALRSLKAPGTAYDDDVLGKDPQPDHLRDYVESKEDNGGVHLDSGIPNRAFYEFAAALGGHAWERAGAVWYDTLTGGALAPTSGFRAFALATADAAAKRFGAASDEATAVLSAWDTVGVEPGHR